MVTSAAVPAVVGTAMIGTDGFLAVSYTHLDVYKRQIEICAITTVTAAINAIQQISCTEIFACCILKTPFLFLLVKVYRMLLRLSTLLFHQLTFRIVP